MYSTEEYKKIKLDSIIASLFQINSDFIIDSLSLLQVLCALSKIYPNYYIDDEEFTIDNDPGLLDQVIECDREMNFKIKPKYENNTIIKYYGKPITVEEWLYKQSNNAVTNALEHIEVKDIFAKIKKRIKK